MIFSRLGNYRLLWPHFKNASGKFELVLLDDEVFAKAMKDFTLPTNYMRAQSGGGGEVDSPQFPPTCVHATFNTDHKLLTNT